MSAPAPASLRPKTLGRLARLTVGATILGGVIAIFATARASRIEPEAHQSPLGADERLAPERPADPMWTLADSPLERVGYRQGRRHVFEVVPLGPSGIEVEVGTARAFLAMHAAAAEASVELGLVSGFRTAEQQRVLFRAWRKGRGNKAAAPGRSNHQSGRALDINLADPAAYAWLEANAASFGFKRTVKSEPWHWEYVDSPIARGATKRISRKKAAKSAKAVGHMTRPTRRPSTVASSRRASTLRVATARP